MKKRKFMLRVIISVYLILVCSLAVSAEEASLSMVEEDLICRFIDAACGEDAPLATKLGVANVVLNRLDDSNFPQSVTGVIFEGDFECVAEGSLEKAYLKRRSVSAEDALQMALAGCDPTGGAVYFAEKSLSAEELIISFEAGRLVFGK